MNKKLFSKYHPGYSTNKSAVSNSLIKTIKNSKNLKTLASKLPAPKYVDEESDLKLVESRRESSDVYSSMIKNTSVNESQRDSVNISVKRTRANSRKRNFDYLEVKISQGSRNGKNHSQMLHLFKLFVCS
jgi:hypothetical protein